MAPGLARLFLAFFEVISRLAKIEFTREIRVFFIIEFLNFSVYGSRFGPKSY